MALRHAVLLLSLIALSLICANMTVLNFSKNCMIRRNVTESNESVKITFVFSGTQESTLLSAIAWGILLSALPSSWLLHRFGARIVFTAFGLLAAFVTAIMPLVIFLKNDRENKAFVILTICRVLQGISVGCLFPVMGSITSHWAPLSETGLFLGLLTCCVQIAPFLSNPIAGQFCGNSVQNGWPMVYWLFALLTLLIFCVWVFVYRNDAQSHPWSHREIVEEERRDENDQKSTAIPVKSMLKSAPVWAIIIASLANRLAVQVLVLYTPTYLKLVLNFTNTSTGLLAALPNLLQVVTKVAAGIFSDRSKCCNETLKIKIFNSVAFFGMAIFVLALAFISAEYRTLAVIFIVGAPAIIGAHSGGFLKSTTSVAGQYSAFVMSCIQINVFLAMALEPYIVGALIPVQFMNDQNKWKAVFIIHSALLIAGNVVFCIFASGEPAVWSKINENVLDPPSKSENVPFNTEKHASYGT